MKKTLLILLLIFGFEGYAQNQPVLDEIVAVIGNHIILRSDLEAEYIQAKKDMSFYPGDLKCEILNQLIIQKLYLHKGERDSIYSSPEMVESELDRRVKYYASQIGGEARLAQYLGMTINEYKDRRRPEIENQQVSQKVQSTIVSDIKASPTDVRKFFASIPKDSLPKFGEELELGLISMKPEPSDYAKEYALEKITKIRQDLLRGLYSFDFAAKSNSDDKTTAVNGGELGYFSRGQMVGAFERVAYKLKGDSISEVIETKYGYHILQLIDRKGEKVNARHILIKPLIVKSDLSALRNKMLEIISGLKSDSLSMCKVASDFSTDMYTKDNCGFYADQTTGSQQISIEVLDPLIAAKASVMREGQYSKPEKFEDIDGTSGYRFLYLRKAIPSHTANLKDDYQKIQALALEKKKEDTINKWVSEYKRNVYVRIDEKYASCKELSQWKGLAN
ncbi:MAG: peptidylprolyl isomerase [Bacteroidia bacterium]|nr:peptidylprolyl isomerase [Bacteroidia bacterium]MDG2042789.1 peptidylprolyl isomerase [Bacteroidia bacterium]